MLFVYSQFDLDDEKLINEFEKWISELEQTIETLRKDEEDYHQWLEINTHKRALEFLLCKREHTRIVNRLTQVIFIQIFV